MKPLQFAYSPRCPFIQLNRITSFLRCYAFAYTKLQKIALCGIALRNRLRQLKCNLYETFEENLHHHRQYHAATCKLCCIVIDGARAPFRDYDNLKVNISSHFSKATGNIFFLCRFASKIEEDWCGIFAFIFILINSEGLTVLGRMSVIVIIVYIGSLDCVPLHMRAFMT